MDRPVRSSRCAAALVAALLLLPVALDGIGPVRAADPVTGFWADNIHNLLGYENGQGHLISGANSGASGGAYHGRPCGPSPTAPECLGWIEVRFSGQPPSDNADGVWEAHFAAPLGQELTVGTYTDAVYPLRRSGSQPGLSIDPFTTNYCLAPTGTFTIHELTMSGDEVTSIAATFVQVCAGEQEVWGPLYGEVRLNASVGFVAAGATPWPVAFGQHDTGTSAGTRDVTVRSLGSQAVHLGSATILGEAATSFAVESNACDGAVLQPGESCLVRVSARPATNGVLKARLELADDTVRGKRVIPLTVEGLGEVAGTLTVGPQTFYPVVDGYRDVMVVEGDRDEVAAVSVRVRSAASGNVVREGALASATGPFRWTWDGKVAGGGLAPVGAYDVTAALVAPVGNRRVVERQVRLSHHWVEWTKRSVTLPGRAFSLYGISKNATVSLAGSAWSDGVRLTSGRGAAAVVYAFNVRSASIYGSMSFQVRGRSRNGHKALIAIWNPSLGSARDLSHYDAARKIGPGYQRWATSTQGQGRVKVGIARGAVMVWRGLGGTGSSVFDIQSVSLIYRTGVLRAPAEAAESNGTAAPRGPAAWESGDTGPLVDRVIRDLLPFRLRPAEPTPLNPDPVAIPEQSPAPTPLPAVDPDPSATSVAPTSEPAAVPETVPMPSMTPDACAPAEACPH
jgi:hypothetical protein